MSRRVRVKTNEMGFVELFLIYNYAGTWEPEWRALQDASSITSLFATLEHDEMEQAFIGWTRPLVNALGPPPKGALIKLPLVTRTCANQRGCTLFIPKHCGSLLPKMPNCFEPEGFDEPIRRLASEIVRLWREGVYVVVVGESKHADR